MIGNLELIPRKIVILLPFGTNVCGKNLLSVNLLILLDSMYEFTYLPHIALNRARFLLTGQDGRWDLNRNGTTYTLSELRRTIVQDMVN